MYGVNYYCFSSYGEISVCMCECAYVAMCIQACMHTHTHTHTQTHTHMQTDRKWKGAWVEISVKQRLNWFLFYCKKHLTFLS